MHLEGTEPSTLTVSVDFSGQHTISWNVDVREVVMARSRVPMTPAGRSALPIEVSSGRAWRAAQELCNAAADEQHGPLAALGPRPPAKVATERWRVAAAARAAAIREAKRWRSQTANASGDHADGKSIDSLDLEDEREDVCLPAGSCNLYKFPTATSKDYPNGSHPSAGGLRILHQIVMKIALDESAFAHPDEVGAYPIHALIVCNSPESLVLGMEIYHKVPAMLPLLHVNSRAGVPIFVGESSLHILAVNRHEDELVTLIDQIHRMLPPEEARKHLNSQAVGLFFRDTPMFNYGGSPMSYAVVFEMPDAVRALLATGMVSLNSREDACKLSGFLPIHACIANSLPNMYDLLTRELPPELRSSETLVTLNGSRMDLHLYDLSCMQLAARLGDHRMLRHMLRKQCQILWIWGPVTSFALDLNGIDSAGEGGGDIMELITRNGASEKTTSMLLDSFMNGFIHQLFVEKWYLFGRRLHLFKRGCELLLLFLSLALSFQLKVTPQIDDGTKAIAVATLFVIAFILEEEVRIGYLFAKNEQGTDEANRLSLPTLLSLTLQHMRCHNTHIMVIGHFFLIIACLLVLRGRFPSPDDFDVSTIYVADYGGHAGNATFRRMLKATGSSSGVSSNSDSGSDFELVDEGEWNLLWFALAFGEFFLFWHFASVAFTPLSKVHLLLLSIGEIFAGDVSVFIVVYAWMVITFFSVCSTTCCHLSSFTQPSHVIASLAHYGTHLP